MPVTLVVLAVAVLAAVAAYVVSLSSRAPVDPIDPDAEIGWLLRRLHNRPKLVRFLRARMDRTTATGFVLTTVFIVVFASAFAIGSLVDQFTAHSGFARFDQGVANWGATNVSSRAVSQLRLVTDLGSTPVVIAVALVVGAVVSWRRRRPGPAAFMASVVIGQLLLNNALKLAVNRTRPDVARLVSVAGSSFPSGHTTAAAATWAAVALAFSFGHSRRTRAVAGSLAALIAVAVGTTRALLGAHWLTDVLAGLALGWGWFTLVAITFGGRTLRAAAPVEQLAGATLPATPSSVTPDDASGTRPAPVGAGSTTRLAPTSSGGARHRVMPVAGRVVGRAVGALVALVAVWTAIGWLIVHVVDHSAIGHDDNHVNVWAVGQRTARLDRITSFLSGVGSTMVVIGLAVIAVVVLRLVFKRWQPSLVLAVGLLVEVAAFVATANIVGRARPDVARLDPSPPTSSFPSGHTAASVALYVGLAVIVTRGWRSGAGRRIVLGVAVCVPVVVAWARVYRGMHHVSDVVFGALLGAAAIAVAHWAVRLETPPEATPGKSRSRSLPASSEDPVPVADRALTARSR